MTQVEIKPDVDVIAIWKGFGRELHEPGLWESKARVRIWKGDECFPTVVVFSDLDESGTGTSITNCSENLATRVKWGFGLEGPIQWVEHYPRHNQPHGTPQWLSTEDVSLVSYQMGRDGRYYGTRWLSTTREVVEAMVKSSIDMDGYKTVAEHRLI
ncbi:MAG: hypothetical protein F6J86_06180 [Symploca sp. SIO1B1]|nr:hypothetical protein [Symploca sp. SIO2G7]NER93410.1 hypothetical protein [Symploca sp. SIO1B1]